MRNEMQKNNIYWAISMFIIISFVKSMAEPPPGTPSLSSPTNQASVTPFYRLTLSWCTLSHATKYDIMISTEAWFSTTVFSETGTSDTQYLMPKPKPNTTYFWRVKASPQENWSHGWQFHSGDSALRLSLPKNLAIDQDTIISLRWEPLVSASSYHLIVSTSKYFESTFFDTILQPTSVTISRLSMNTCYYWKVSGTVQDSTKYSETWKFSTPGKLQDANFSIGFGATFDFINNIDANRLYTEADYQNNTLSSWLGLEVKWQSGKLFSSDSMNANRVIVDSSFDDTTIAHIYSQKTKTETDFYSANVTFFLRGWHFQKKWLFPIAWSPSKNQSIFIPIVYFESRVNNVVSEPSLTLIKDSAKGPNDSSFPPNSKQEHTIWNTYFGAGFAIKTDSKFSLKMIDVLSLMRNGNAEHGIWTNFGIVTVDYLINPIGIKIGADIRGPVLAKFNQAPQMLFYVSKNIDINGLAKLINIP